MRGNIKTSTPTLIIVWLALPSRRSFLHLLPFPKATQTTSLDLKEQWVVNIVTFIRHHLKDVKKGWFNLEEVSWLQPSDWYLAVANDDIVGGTSSAGQLR